ncbi:MAG: glucans biosynthesis glucosyltransferase H [Candidatus Binatia bacterium]|nr:MAG: glucans biosynthesis glucosyltransferase H [Candidatus Binatia bacterium]
MSAAAPERAELPDWLSGPLSPERLLCDWASLHRQFVAYAESLGFPADTARRCATEACYALLGREDWKPEDFVRAGFESLRDTLERFAPAPEGVVGGRDRFLFWRLWRAALAHAGSPDEVRKAVEHGRLSLPPAPTPPLARASFVPNRLVRSGLFWRIEDGRNTPPSRRSYARERRGKPWTRVARRRRAVLLSLVFLPTLVATNFMLDVLPQRGATYLELAIALFFGALFGWISVGFWTAVTGFFLLLRKADRFAVLRDVPEEGPLPSPEARTAVVMPVCEEPPARVFAALRTMERSLRRLGAADRFDFFVLSDTADPARWLDEEFAWFRWRLSEGLPEGVFYRRRRARVERKSGNIADFCRRWGGRYRYMVVLDADSLMAGETLLRLVRAMEANPRVGMIQTAPRAFGRRSLFGRIQQFGSRLYGPVFAAGLHFWELGDGHYWGHNAIIRLEPFLRFCGLPRLPGEPPLGGEILSHDFVEAALMGRAGWEIWLAYDAEGTYEEVPSSLLEEMQRDRRWCQGNLQHLRLLFARGVFGAHRALFLNGAMAYVSAALWFVFLVLSSAEAIWQVLREPDYFPHGRSLFPEWPVWRPDWAVALVFVTAAILFLPKVLALALVFVRGRSRDFGGAAKLVGSALLESVFSALLAPIRMVFHTRFVLGNLFGKSTGWRSQRREDAETSWTEALTRHGGDTLLATVWGAGLLWLNPEFFWWLTPVLGALLFSVPLSVWASRVRWGETARRLGLFLVPEETRPPALLRDFELELRREEEAGRRLPGGVEGAVADPLRSAVHAVLRRNPRSLAPRLRERREELLRRALAGGPAALEPRELSMLLRYPRMVEALHRSLWEVLRPEESPWFRGAGLASAHGREIAVEGALGP